MKPYFECSDKLNKPYEAFLFDAQTSEMFPILPHWHYFVEILYMVEGKAYVEAGEENYVLEPGDLIVFYPQMAHAIYSAGQLPIRYYVLKFDPVHLNISGSALPPISSLITMAAVEQKLSVYFSKEKFNQEKMKQLIQGSVKTLEEKQFGYDIIMHSNYCLLMAEILTVRLQKAEDLLQFTDFDLTYISQETGFCDCSHFIKAFKQKYGVTPRKYRMCHILYSK